MTDIKEFISRRFPEDCDWLTGNCLWFAYILKARFPHVKIMYLPIEGHFIVKSENDYFDWTGKIEPQEEPIDLLEIEEQDPLWYYRLIRDCWM